MRFLADENFDNTILGGLRRLLPTLDIMRVQDTEIFGAADPEVLAWAAQQDRILITHDAHTLIGFAYERVKASLSMPGVIEVASTLPVGMAIEHLTIMIGASTSEDFESQVKYVPIR